MKIVTSITICVSAGNLEPLAYPILNTADERPQPHRARYLDREDEVAAVLSKLADIGLVDTGHRTERGGPDLLSVTRTRRWSERDLFESKYVMAAVRQTDYAATIGGFDVSQLDGDPRWSLESNDAERAKIPWLAAWLCDTLSFAVRVDGVPILKLAGISGYDLLPTRQYVDRKLPGPPECPVKNPKCFRHLEPKPQHVWYQLFPKLELPKMHSSVLRRPLGNLSLDYFPIDRGPGAMFNEGFDDFQPAWNRKDLDAVGDFDIARTYETIFEPPRGALTIISQRCYRFLKEQKGLSLHFRPVKIVD